MNRNTLSLKKPAPKPAEEMRQHANKKTRAEQSFINMPVVVQGKSPSHWCGVVESFDGGWLILNGEERRWMPDGSLSEVVCKGRFTIERSAIGYLCEVKHD